MKLFIVLLIVSVLSAVEMKTMRKRGRKRDDNDSDNDSEENQDWRPAVADLETRLEAFKVETISNVTAVKETQEATITNLEKDIEGVEVACQQDVAQVEQQCAEDNQKLLDLNAESSKNISGLQQYLTALQEGLEAVDADLWKLIGENTKQITSLEKLLQEEIKSANAMIEEFKTVVAGNLTEIVEQGEQTKENIAELQLDVSEAKEVSEASVSSLTSEVSDVKEQFENIVLNITVQLQDADLLPGLSAQCHTSVVFTAFLTETVDTPPTVLIFDSVAVNIGNAYDNTTGIFVAPHDGIYQFHAHIVTTEDTEVELKAGESGSQGLGNSGGEKISIAVFYTGHLKANEEASVKLFSGSVSGSMDLCVSMFTGFLVKNDGCL